MMKRGVRGKARSSAKDAKAVSTETDVQDAPVSRERLRTIFDKFDVDGTGSLAIDDLVSFYRPFAETTVLRASLEAADTETDGSLSFEQFSSAYDQFWRKRKAKAPKTTPLEAGLPEGMQSRAVESTVEEARARAEEAEASAEKAKQHLETLDMEHNALTLRISALEARVRRLLQPGPIHPPESTDAFPPGGEWALPTVLPCAFARCVTSRSAASVRRRRRRSRMRWLGESRR